MIDSVMHFVLSPAENTNQLPSNVPSQTAKKNKKINMIDSSTSEHY